jgi:hypothetical protein
MSFKKWCAPYANPLNLSHALMDGGVLSIPFDTLTAFYEEYVRAVNAGEKVRTITNSRTSV